MLGAKLFLGGPLPDCVFAVTDVMAVGALARLRANGLAVPADIRSRRAPSDRGQ